MPRVLIVEDKRNFQWTYRKLFEGVVGEGNVDVAGDYATALSFLDREYAAYILDGQFPRERGSRECERLGIELAWKIQRKEGGFEKITVVSGDDWTLEEAERLGIPRVYNKTRPTLLDDLKSVLESQPDQQ